MEVGLSSSRLRLFVLDAERGRPRRGIPVGVAAEGPWVDSEGAGERLVLGLFASDPVGYVSAPIPMPEDATRIVAYPLADPGIEVDLGPWLAGPLAPKADLGPAVAPLLVPPHIAPEPELGLPSIVDPDLDDWHLSPASFASSAAVQIGEDGCEELLSSTAAERTFRFQQLVREPSETPDELEIAKFAECEKSLQKVAPLCWRRGALLEYEMTWIPAGHALGEVVYSLPLAPCETVSLAIVDWSRSDDAFRGEDLAIDEQLRHALRRERAVEETVAGMLSERQRGSSFMAGRAGAGGMSWGQMGSFSGTDAIGTASATTEGRRRLTADAVQQLADGVVQAGSAQRRLNSTVVVQASQAERDAVETRSVANHNHCHALTVLYYEVLRHFRVRTRLAATRDVIFIRRPFLDFKNRRVVRKYRDVLAAALLDPSLGHCFEALEKERCAELALARGETLEEPADHELGAIEARIRTGPEGIPPDSTLFGEGSGPTGVTTLRRYYAAAISLVTASAEIPLIVEDELGWEDGSGRVWRPEPGHIATRMIPAVESTQVLQAGQRDFLTLRPGRRIPWSEVRALKVSFATSWDAPAEVVWRLASLSLRTVAGSDHWTLYDDAPERRLTTGESFELPVGPYGPREPEDFLTEEEHCCVENLLEHLSDHRHHYSRAVWLAENPDERAAWLDSYAFAVGPQRGRLLDFVENRIVGVAGDYVALPSTSDEFARTIDGAAPVERIVSLPARGVFAEAKLGSCNACEERDPTRYWDWSESPCPPPPQIAPVSLGTRARDVIPGAPGVPAPTLGVEVPPEAPAPGEFIGEVLELLGKSDIFRDMSAREELSEMVGKLIDGAVAMELAKQRGAAAGATGTRAGSGGRAGAEAAPATAVGERPSAGGGARALSQATDAAEKARLLEVMEEKNLLSPGTAQAAGDQLAYSLTPVQYSPTRPTGPGTIAREGGFVDNWLGCRLLFANFDVNSTSLKTEHERWLQAVVDVFQGFAHRDNRVDFIQGRASPTGPEAHNVTLSRERAAAVRAYLLDGGIAPEQIAVEEGLGSADPLRPPGTPPGEIDYERSVLLSVAVFIPPPRPPVRRRVRPVVSSPPSDTWEIALRLNAAGGEGLGVAAYIGYLKNCANGEVRRISYIGGGLAGGAAATLPLPDVDWYRFRTIARYTFDEFDGAFARFTTLGAGLGGGASVSYLDFPGMITSAIGPIWDFELIVGADGITSVGATFVEPELEFYEPCI